MTVPIVITGAGVVSPYGIGLNAFADGLASGRSCIREITAYDLTRCRASKGAYYTDFKADDFDPSSGFGRVARGTQFSIIATDEALRAARVPRERMNPAQTGLVFTSSRVALEKTEKFYGTLLQKGPRFVNPLVFQETVNNAPASHICLRYDITGPSLTITSGGAGTIQAIAVAMGWLRMGRVSIAVVTAAESLHAISQEVHSFARGHAPVDAAGVNESCPFDRRRNGYLFGEGAVSFVLETSAHAVARGADIKATVAGYGVTHEASAVGRFQPDGFGMERAMLRALQVDGEDGLAVQWILAGAHSAPVADLAEARALRRVFGAEETRPPVSAIKSMIGETEAASGGFNMLAAITGMQAGLLYPTINYDEPDPDCDVNLVTKTPRQEPVTVALINSIWYGGGNGAILLRKPRTSDNE